LSSFLTNLFEDINIARIFYKSSQTCGTKTQNVFYFGTEGVYYCLLVTIGTFIKKTHTETPPKAFLETYNSTLFEFCAEANQGTGIREKFHGH